MNIIVVGPDGTGKSTLVSRLSEELNMPVYHGRGVHKDKTIRWSKMEQWDGVIFDRAYLIDDQVYAPVVGVTPETWDNNSPLIENAFVIYWDNSRAIDILHERGDDYISPHMVTEIRKGYGDFFRENPNLSPDVIFKISDFDNFEAHVATIIKIFLEKTK